MSQGPRQPSRSRSAAGTGTSAGQRGAGTGAETRATGRRPRSGKRAPAASSPPARKAGRAPATTRNTAATRMKPASRTRNPRQANTRHLAIDPISEAPVEIDVWPWIHVAIGCLLVVPTFITSQAFFDSVLGAALDRSFWSHPGFWWFGVGGLCWVLLFHTCPRPMFLYVLGHELTHYAFVRLSGGQVRSFKVSGSGGYVETDRNNWMIALSPYFVPFYTVVAALLFGVSALVIDLHGSFNAPWPWSGYEVAWSDLLLGVVGFTWAFHLTFTVWMISGDQPDLRHYGVFLSLMLIYLANLIVVTVLLIAASDTFTWSAFVEAWWNAAHELLGWLRPVAAL